MNTRNQFATWGAFPSGPFDTGNPPGGVRSTTQVSPNAGLVRDASITFARTASLMPLASAALGKRAVAIATADARLIAVCAVPGWLKVKPFLPAELY